MARSEKQCRLLFLQNINRQGLDLSSSHPIAGETPLTMAVLKGWLKGVRLLLILRANPSIPNIDGLTPLMLAHCHYKTPLFKDPRIVYEGSL